MFPSIQASLFIGRKSIELSGMALFLPHFNCLTLRESKQSTGATYCVVSTILFTPGWRILGAFFRIPDAYGKYLSKNSCINTPSLLRSVHYL